MFTNKKTIVLFFVLLFILDIFVWRTIVLDGKPSDLSLYFLVVGQGDGELVILPGGVKILIDGGPNGGALLNDLAVILPATDRYIDLVINSHPHPDHFIGLIDVLKVYKVGAFICNGLDGGSSAWQELMKIVRENKTLTGILAAKDKIKYRDNEFDILSPDDEFIKSEDLNDTSLVALLKSGKDKFKVLFMGDAGALVEKRLLSENIDVGADVLKVGHHGSKYASTEEFLRNVLPKAAAIEVGENVYGHPTKEVLNALALVGANVFRTDIDGIVKIAVASDFSKFQVFKEKW